MAQEAAAFQPGAEVEVASGDVVSLGVFLQACVIGYDPLTATYTVDYDTLLDSDDPSRPRREAVPASRVRPRAPAAPEGGEFELHQVVDARCKEGWRMGVVSLVPVEGKKKSNVTGSGKRKKFWFTVCFPSSQEERKFRLSELRPHFEWVNGKWLSSQSMETPEIVYSVGSQVKVARHQKNWFTATVVKIIWNNIVLVKYDSLKGLDKEPLMEAVDCQHVKPHHQISEKPLNMEFKEGMIVEISSEDEGFHGAWFAATVMKSTEENFLVEYHHLKTEDDTGHLTETVDSFHIRPTPPDTSDICKFKLFEEVDAFHNDGWWVGIVSKILDNQNYHVYFKTWQEQTEFTRKDLRLHYDWMDGRWMRASQVLGV